MRLKKALEQRAKAIDIERTLHTPKNTEAITILKRPQHLARVGGVAASPASVLLLYDSLNVKLQFNVKLQHLERVC